MFMVSCGHLPKWRLGRVQTVVQFLMMCNPLPFPCWESALAACQQASMHILCMLYHTKVSHQLPPRYTGPSAESRSTCQDSSASNDCLPARQRLCHCSCELHLREIHMLDWYGGMHIISPDAYFAARLDQQTQQQDQQQQEARKLGRFKLSAGQRLLQQ